MSRRTKSSVIAKVSQTESKLNSKQEGQPPEDNFYIAVTPSLTYVLKHICTTACTVLFQLSLELAGVQATLL